MNIYEHCPEIAGERFCLRFVREADCDDLLRVYSDPAAVPLFNSDNCGGDDFNYTTYDRMLQAIQYWLWEYSRGGFVRWSIIDTMKHCAVGTVELFRRSAHDAYDGCGILRLDLCSDYEREAVIFEILLLLLPQSFGWFDCERIATKAKPCARNRIAALQKMGFQLSTAPLIGHDGTAYGDYFVLIKDQKVLLCTT